MQNAGNFVADIKDVLKLLYENTKNKTESDKNWYYSVLLFGVLCM